MKAARDGKKDQSESVRRFHELQRATDLGTARVTEKNLRGYFVSFTS
jgi:hypothetical protein